MTEDKGAEDRFFDDPHIRLLEANSVLTARVQRSDRTIELAGQVLVALAPTETDPLRAAHRALEYAKTLHDLAYAVARREFDAAMADLGLSPEETRALILRQEQR